jgi:two-component system NtrC family sensor kinase
MTPNKKQDAMTGIEKQGRLIDAEAQLALTIRHLPLGYIVWNRDLLVLEWNRAAERIFGWSAAEIRGKHASILMPSPAEDVAPDPLQTALLPKGDSGTTVMQCVNKDGATLVCDWHTSLLRDATGAVQGYLSMVQDITAREQAERELRKSRTFLETIIDTEPECVKLVAEDGSLQMMNRAGLDMIQAGSLEQVRGHALGPLIAAGHREPFFALLHEVFRGKTGRLEFEMVGLKGRKLRLESHAVPLRNEKNEIVALLAITRDVTQRREAEEELKKERDFTAKVLDIVGAMVLVLDRTGAIVRFNHACEEVSGYPAAEALGRHVWDFLIPPEQVPGVRNVFANLAAGMFPSRYENCWVTKDGKRKLIAWSNTALVNGSGEVEHVIATGIDLSERAKLEELLRHSQKMESLGTLAGGIAHDFNNILTAVTGYGSLLQAKLADNEPLKAYVVQMMTAATRATTLTQGLLAYGRKQQLHPVPTNLNEIVARVGDFLRRLIGEDIELKILLTDRDLTVLADAIQIEQVLMNIATNAREAMAGGGYLFIETNLEDVDGASAAEHGLDRAGAHAVVTLTDTGKGIDDAARAHIFEPFFTTRARGTGTGLGLPVAYGIIKQHNGAISVIGAPGRGTTFKVYLPLARAADAGMPAPGEAAIIGGTETVLVAEDDEVVRQVLAAILSQYGYSVIEAKDGEEAVNRFMEHQDRVKLLLLDAVMPKKTGREAYDKIRIFRPEVRALFLSGYPADVMVARGLIEPGTPVMVKPVGMDELLRKVRAELDS